MGPRVVVSILWGDPPSTPQAPPKHPSSTPQAPLKHPSSTPQAFYPPLELILDLLEANFPSPVPIFDSTILFGWF